MTEISVIIPAFNEEDYLPCLLESIKEQDFDNFEVIVVDNNSSDNTAEIAKEFEVNVVEEKKQGPGYARNRGAIHASGDTLLFLDADVILPYSDTLDRVRAILQTNDTVAGTGVWQPSDGNYLQRKLTSLSSDVLRFASEAGIDIASGAFIFIKSDIFRKIDGFNGDLPFNEDHDLIKRAKLFGNTRFINNICLISTRRLQARGVLGTAFDYGIPTVLYILGMRRRLESYEFESI